MSYVCSFLLYLSSVHISFLCLSNYFSPLAQYPFLYKRLKSIVACGGAAVDKIINSISASVT